MRFIKFDIIPNSALISCLFMRESPQANGLVYHRADIEIMNPIESFSYHNQDVNSTEPTEMIVMDIPTMVLAVAKSLQNDPDIIAAAERIRLIRAEDERKEREIAEENKRLEDEAEAKRIQELNDIADAALERQRQRDIEAEEKKDGNI